MAVLDSAVKTVFSVLPGGTNIPLHGLVTGTLYGVYFKGIYGAQKGNAVVPTGIGPGMSALTFSGLPGGVQTTITGFAAETGAAAYPAGLFVAGASVNYAATAPQFSIDSDASNDITRVIRVAVPDFNTAPPTGLKYIEVRISRDLGKTYSETTKINIPYSNGLNYGVVSISVPYEQDVYVAAQAFYNDGAPGRISRTLILKGYAKPAKNTLAAPTALTAVGSLVYSAATNTVQLSLTTTAIPDPLADALQIRMVNTADNSVKDAQIIAVNPASPQAVLKAVFGSLDATVATYNVVAASMKSGIGSVETTLLFTTPAANTYLPNPINPATIQLSEVIVNTPGVGLQSKIQVKWVSDQSQPTANIYIRRRDNLGTDPNLFTGFTAAGVGISGPIWLSDPITAVGATVTWDVLVLAVGVTGTEAAFTSAQVKTVAVQQYANYAPINQALPTVVAVNPDQVSLIGTYARPSNTPAPTSVNIYKSETLTDAASLVARVTLQPTSDPTAYKWLYDVQSLTTQFATAGVSLITIRYALENGTETATANKSVVKVVASAPATVPTISAATAYVKTVGATITNCTASLVNAVTGYSPATGGNGTTLTFTPPLNAIIIEVSDDGAGLNAEIITPQTDMAAPTMWATFAPTKNQGTKYVRAKFNTQFGLTGFSTPAKSITFPADNVVDTTCTISGCTPRFVSNADGSITLTWTAGVFGTTKLGSYVIRRNTTNTLVGSYPVGSVSVDTNLTWTDTLPTDKQGYTYYYWLEATNAQGYGTAASAATQAKIQSGNSWAVETITGAVSTDAIPSTVGSITSVGAPGGFNVTWAGVADRDLKEYQLEFSALGTFADTVTLAVNSNSYFQTLGATATSTVAAVYRWRIKAKDFSNQLSAAYATSAAPDLTNYGMIIPIISRPSLVYNGHFGTSFGNYGTSYTGWTLGGSTTFLASGRSLVFNGFSYSMCKFTRTGATAAVLTSQVIQVVPGVKYSVMGMIYYEPTTLDGNAYIRVAGAGTLSNNSNGASTLPAPYSAATNETSGTDVTTVRGGWRAITYSFVAPAAVSSMTLNIGFEGRTATDSVSLYPAFIQVYQDQ